MSDEIIPWEVDTRITGLQAEIESLRSELDNVHGQLVSVLGDLVNAEDFIQRLMKELSQHGWGDERYMQYPEQDRNIVALLEEGGFQFERIETIDINTEPNVFERDPEPGTERAEIHTTNTQTPTFKKGSIDTEWPEGWSK